MRNQKVLSVLTFICSASVCFADVGPKNKSDTARKVRVAVIDTGIAPEMMTSNTLCHFGHKDFTGKGLADNHGHGTHISGVIDQYAKNFILGQNGNGQKLEEVKLPEYCQIILKYYDPKGPGDDNLKNTIKAFRWAIDNKVNIINYSGGGEVYSEEERKVVVEALDKGIIVVAAAGNENNNIDKYKYYPAMYDKRIYVVGNLVKSVVRKPSKNKDELIGYSSNYGLSVNTWEIGTQVLSRLPSRSRGFSFGYMSGTSQATAVKSGKIVREMLQTK